MKSGKKVFKFIALSFILVFEFYPLAANASDAPKPKAFSDMRTFYTETTRGSLALELAETKLINFATGQKYELDRKGKYEFIVNHRHSSTSDYTYLAVEVIRLFPPGKDHKRGFGMKRNDGWVRTSGGPVPNNLECWNSSITLKKFKKIHSQDNLVYADERLECKWHAQPDSNGESSWEQHQWWATEIKNSPIENRDIDSTAHGSYRLYRFREMNKYDTENHLRFNVLDHGCSDLFIRTYSPISEKFIGYYYFEIK